MPAFPRPLRSPPPSTPSEHRSFARISCVHAPRRARRARKPRSPAGPPAPSCGLRDGALLSKQIARCRAQVYEGHTYKLSFKFPTGYPYEPPQVTFGTPCFHPNVDQYGNICLDILKEKWSAAYNVRTILLSIQSLLADPNLDSPLNGHAAAIWHNQQEYKKAMLKHKSNQRAA